VQDRHVELVFGAWRLLGNVSVAFGQDPPFGDEIGGSESRHSLRCTNAPKLTSMVRYGAFVLIVLLGLGGLAIVLVRSRRRMQSAKSRNIWDYVLLWPLILDPPTRREWVAAGGRFFTAP
jgi:hypothetical protein